MTAIAYNDDKTWVASKQLAKLAGFKDDWLTVVTYYNVAKGQHVKMYALDKDDGYYRVIGNTERGHTLLLAGGALVVADTVDVKTYRKFFEFSDKKLRLKKLALPEPIKGDNYIYYNN